MLNGQTNFTQVLTYPAGDRIKLESLNLAKPGSNVSLSVSTAPGTAASGAAPITGAPRPASGAASAGKGTFAATAGSRCT